MTICIEDEEFATIDKLLLNKMNEVAKRRTPSSFHETKHLIRVRNKLLDLKCTTLSKYDTG
jgi:hypothetical protein